MRKCLKWPARGQSPLLPGAPQLSYDNASFIVDENVAAVRTSGVTE